MFLVFIFKPMTRRTEVKISERESMTVAKQRMMDLVRLEKRIRFFKVKREIVK